MTPMQWAYVWLSCSAIWFVGGLLIALTGPKPRPGLLLAWLFGGMFVLMSSLFFQPQV